MKVNVWSKVKVKMNGVKVLNILLEKGSLSDDKMNVRGPRSEWKCLKVRKKQIRKVAIGRECENIVRERRV